MKRRIVFSTISLDRMAGGLERNIARVANHFAGQGHDVALLTFDLPGAVSFFPIDPRVEWIQAGRTQPHTKINFFERLGLLKRMRAALKPKDGKATIVIAFHHGILLRLFAAGLFLKKIMICSERNSLSIYEHIRQRKWNFNFLILGLCKRIAVQFERYRADYPRWLQGRIFCIPNLVELAPARAKPETPDAHGRYKILAVGRLCDQKRYACLIEAFATLAADFLAWDLVILGDGPLQERLEMLAREEGLKERVSFPGAVPHDEITNWYRAAHIYCMPSKWEGFPNALAEALAHGLPSVGFRACAGVSDLIENERNGLLAEGQGDAEKLAGALRRLMNDPIARQVMGTRADESVAPYAAHNIYALWDSLLASV